DESFLEYYRPGIESAGKELKTLRELTSDNPNQQKRIADLEPLVVAKLAALKHQIDLRQRSGFEAAAKVIQVGEGKRLMDSIINLADQMMNEENDLLKRRAEEVEAASNGAKAAIIWGTLFCLLFVTATGIFLTRSLSRQIGSAVGQVQSSSAELQATANQQATGAKEQATAMNEIATTISELLATSRQIAESAQRVAQIADQTTKSARTGDGTVVKANASIVSIRQQVDLIVSHMLDLGKKSQQIGAVLDIVSELAEQTNILAINATIEATGAGEAGKRFAVVADEIRKLADRVTGSTKEIRTLIDDVRSAVNTSVMTTETGSKSVDAGSRQFDEVASAFKQIAELVVTTTEAAREIELSTKQQSSAVEQVNVAITNAAQATRENEASSTQILQTSSQLATLSRDLLRLVQPQAIGMTHGA
ncbi:MAG TPA: methyl-accepting chemotaxis protein, partial [Herminiimonas sp.]|nr:methyl-accepting chemotaxis protein [Herminiimonas sp.]